MAIIGSTDRTRLKTRGSHVPGRHKVFLLSPNGLQHMMMGYSNMIMKTDIMITIVMTYEQQ